ncbi:hypothetical protein BDR03DRAFT_964632 [Suillus americanus]|nr:hypothetical protein BDR03DRAFT_964632 [Suillus americanus]
MYVFLLMYIRVTLMAMSLTSIRHRAALPLHSAHFFRPESIQMVTKRGARHKTRFLGFDSSHSLPSRASTVHLSMTNTANSGLPQGAGGP